MERALLFRLLSLNNSQHSLIYFIRYEKTSSLVGYQTIIHSVPTMDPTKASVSGCADLHCITSGVAFLSLLCKAVQHSSPGNYMSIAWESKNRNSEMLTSTTWVQLKISIFLGVLSDHHSLCSAPKPSSSNPYLYPHAFLKPSGQLVGSSCLYTANQAKFSRSRRKYMHFSLISFDKTFTQTKILRTTAESQTGYSHVLRSRDQYSPKSDKVDVLPLFLFCIFLILTLVFFLVHLNHLKPQLYCSTFQMIFWQYFSDKAHKFSNIKQYVFLDFRKKMVCRVTHISSVQFSRSVVSDSL